jgi:hypothetical protein
VLVAATLFSLTAILVRGVAALEMDGTADGTVLQLRKSPPYAGRAGANAVWRFIKASILP